LFTNIETEIFEQESTVKWRGEATTRRNFEMIDRVQKIDKAHPQMAQKGTKNKV
jgi:hypothetical protein